MLTKEAAKVAGVDIKTLYKHIKDGVLIAKKKKIKKRWKAFHIKAADLEKYMDYLAEFKGVRKRVFIPTGPKDRRIACASYDACLVKAARKNAVDIGCQACEQYEKNPLWLFKLVSSTKKTHYGYLSPNKKEVSK